MATGRVLYAGLALLDRQLVDREGRLCGKVDDLELTVGDDGRAFVTAVLTGPGALLLRTGHNRLGAWLREHLAGDRGRIPLGRVADIGDHVTLAMDADEVATAGGERWVRDHVIGHVPGSRARAPR
jgi:sporulation protein YlmC with PRC-barrel domain